ncbi:hypothetical protein G195_001951 [Phytophthora kernoviae 00238/432]|uniref:RNA polymerase sigma-70 region 2 domain-containing protein n=1 Tax=Phytophthora kernoviae 00238/432 TaxID=1284355 RepID=A0A8J4WAJ2_9STRA|nr:hypothetical protein G195_001951 [Phytophthora kernoviae 00238/432]
MTAEETVQELFLRVWNNAERYEASQGKLTTWMFAITRNIAVDMLRRKSKSAATTSVENETLAAFADEHTNTEEEIERLEAEEVAAFEAHLAHCESCRQEVRELQEVTGFLPLAAEPVAPPPGMRARVLGNVLGHAQVSAGTKPAAAPAEPEAPVVLQADLAPLQEAAQPGQGLPPETAVPAARAEEAAQAQPWQPQGRARARSSRAWRIASAALAAAALVLGIYAGQLQGQIDSLKQH